MINLSFFNRTNFDRERIQQHVKDALDKFHRSDAINDGELDNLIKFFRALEGLCAAMGPSYNLNRCDAGDKLYTLECFKRRRKEHAKEMRQHSKDYSTND